MRGDVANVIGARDPARQEGLVGDRIVMRDSSGQVVLQSPVEVGEMAELEDLGRR